MSGRERWAQPNHHRWPTAKVPVWDGGGLERIREKKEEREREREREREIKAVMHSTDIQKSM